MTKNKINFKMFLLIIFPFVISVVIDRLNVVASIYGKESVYDVANTISNVWKYVCILYWYWVGKKFGFLGKGKRKSFVFGNSLWGLGIIFYIIIFFLTDEANRSKLIKVIPFLNQLAQGYSLGFMSLSTFLLSIFAKDVDCRITMLISYILMLVVFILGFNRGKRRKFI